jgi:hypothetical protein
MRTILVDCDGVLADFIGRVCKVLQGANPKQAHIYNPELFEVYDIKRTLLSTELSWVSSACKQPGFAASLDWYEGAKEWLASIRHLGTVVCLTSPFSGAPSWVQERAEWLRGHVDQVHFCRKEAKRFVPGDLLIEDCAQTAYEWSETQRKPSIILERPWNRRTSSLVIGMPAAKVLRAFRYSGLLNLGQLL